ncbi:MAG TPA: NADH-quinone oxidoreductase subunit D [Dehalococcoidia bacterium]|nr:NADH-quinone oxidoreductase subunit D [Dehalococcoidia bacterium]
MTLQTEPFVVNLGPQHPSTHGVFRLRIVLDGEVIKDADMVMGYLHRSMEKLAEERTYTQNIPFTDRTDYVAAMTGNLAYVMAVEKLVGVEVPERALWLRTIMAELQRLASHCMAVGIFANDCGAWQTPVMHMLRDREKILDLFEMACGARLTVNYMRIGGVSRDIPPEFIPMATKLVKDDMPKRLDEYENLLLENEIIVARSRGVGVLTPEQAIAHSVSGPLLRASGVAWDVRKADPYAAYDKVDFDIAVGKHGDVYDRFAVRMAEMRQSLRILEQALEMIPAGPVTSQVGPSTVQPIGTPTGPLAFRPPAGEAYARIESPRGELGFYIVSDGSPAPFRFHIRSPSFINLSPLKLMSVGGTVADAIVILGSVDIVVGEVDR